ncbi:MAG: M1 family metallopeptidase, partial [Desulfobacterales bacterium]|nr:M1 family metallopeptidase [Desulfobacterales bacterium]
MTLKILFIVFFILCAPIGAWGETLRCALDVAVDVQNRGITGEARLVSEKKRALFLNLHGLSGVKLDDKAVSSSRERLELTLEAGKERVIRFQAACEGPGGNFIDDRNVFLTGAWHPTPEDLTVYALSVTLPEGFLAVSEADAATRRENAGAVVFDFRFERPLDRLTLAASRDYTLQKERWRGIDIETYFFEEDAGLAPSYIEYTKKYLAMYEEMLTPYPFRRFAIVENLFPTGISMPTYTLLGKSVARLPFITRTSLGHEILHQWFGNSVFSDPGSGNWTEGLTSYLADHHYADLQGRGAAHRKGMLINHDAYVNETNAIPVMDFHGQRGRPARAVGYGKVAMFFHGLRKRVGEEAFFDALKDFIRTNSFRRATWHDIQRAFEKASGKTLFAFFAQNLERADIPRLSVEEAKLMVVRGVLTLSFTLVQEGEPYRTRAPLTIHSASGKTRIMIEVAKPRKTFRVPLDEPPTRVTLDEEYDLMRGLTMEETPPVLAKVMGKRKPLVAMPEGRGPL